jgi:hypothetical protein
MLARWRHCSILFTRFSRSATALRSAPSVTHSSCNKGGKISSLMSRSILSIKSANWHSGQHQSLPAGDFKSQGLQQEGSFVVLVRGSDDAIRYPPTSGGDLEWTRGAAARG